MAAERQLIQLTGNIKRPGAANSSAVKEAVQKIIRGNSELFTDTYCKLCHALLDSDDQRLSHYQSKRHAKTVFRYEELHQDGKPVAKRRKKHSIDSRNGEVDQNKSCHVCHMAFTSVADAHLHYQGKNHAKALKCKLKHENTTPASSAAPEAKNPTDRDDHSKLCEVSVGRPAFSKQRFMRKKQKKKMEAKLVEQIGYNPAPEAKNPTDRIDHSKLCEVSVGRSEISKQRRMRKKQKKKVEAKLVEQLEQIGYNSAGGYPCKTCHVVLKSVGHFHAHILGVKHQNRGTFSAITCSQTLALASARVIRLVTSAQRWLQWLKYGQKS
ncbi:zinc finger matrin-type protein 4-like isoform X2 [Scyliorhinus torazame]|uniref:zinc finger matrin-type protein 4-like isoform X2 n=1 Tax=Scyliorhinus torazame TaxID=75743 RepID=UPI003B58F863